MHVLKFFHKMKRLLAAALLPLVMLSILQAEATKEITTDYGFYDNNGTEPFTIGTFQFSINNTNFDKIPSVSQSAREGIEVASTTLNLQWGGWYIMNTTGYGNFIPQLRDYSLYSGGALRFWLLSNESITIEIQHGDPVVTVNSFTVPSTNGAWQEQVIPFSSFTGGGGINFNIIRVPFLVKRTNSPNTETTWLVDHVRWTKPLASLAVFPKTTQVNTNGKRQFTVEGRNSAGEHVIIYTTFTAPGTVGSFNPGSPNKVQASTFTAATTDGNITLAEAGISTAAAVDITSANLKKELGLLSETIPGINLGIDSDLGVVTGGGATLITGNSSDFREGTVSFVSTVTVPSGGFAGWYIQHGTNTTSDAVTRDLNQYYEGSLRFWFKAPSALQNVLQISIRSGNVAPGLEYSKRLLNNYVAFDNQWHAVSIPIKDLAGPRPWADISRIKALVAFFAINDTGGTRAFYIDNLRWDTQIAGPLATMTVSPNPVDVPLSTSRLITAKGFDASGVTVDIFPTWSKTGAIGNISPAQGPTTLLTAAGANATGSITATQGSVSSTTIVNVADPIWTQSYNVYADAGSGGYVGVAVNANSSMNLTEQNLGGAAPEGSFVRRATYSLANQGASNDAFAIWFTNYDSGTGSRYMGFYQTGYLSFWVKTSKDLQISIRSANIAPGTELSKIRLSEYGIPLNNTFQKVVIALDDFKAKEPQLDFNQIQTYFAIGALSEQIGQVSNEVFDVDDVKWLTAAGGAPDEAKVYVGLQEKQQGTGLVQSFSGLPRAVTYDQALAAMNYTYRLDLIRAQNLFNVYQGKFNLGGFAGFHDEYDMNTPSFIWDGDRLAGPNAWMLLALIHYRNVAPGPQNTQYDSMIDGLASWLLSLQDTDGAIKFGFVNGTLQNNKSTEHAFDCYAAFLAYAEMRNNPAYITAASNIATWLTTEAYVPAQVRFNVGEEANGTANADKALDAYSWAPLAMSSYTQVLATAVLDLGTTHACDLTGLPITGFDFSGPVGAPPDKDAVWLEGTGQMALAYYATGQSALGDFYVNELEKSIVTVSQNGQGMPYATNGGTGYGFNMDSLNPCVSSIGWYLFAKKKFNPFQPYPLYGVKVKNIFNNVTASSITWTVNVPTRWVRANQYIQIDAQPISMAGWGIQTYTNNTSLSSVPRYVDPTPTVPINPDSDPAGIGRWQVGVSTTSHKLPLAWRIQESTGPTPAAIAPYTVLTGGSGEAFNWFYFKDRATPAIDLNNNGQVGDPGDGTAFSDGEDYIVVRNASGIHASQGAAGYVPSVSPDYIFLEADYGTAAAQEKYQVNMLSIEFFLQ